MPATPFDYQDFDAKLLQRLSGGPMKFYLLSSHLEPLAKAFCSKPEDELFRVTDRRLQALRKKNLVTFIRGQGWSLIYS